MVIQQEGKSEKRQFKPSRRKFVFRNNWCRGEGHDGMENSIYMPDATCPCKITKHHYHCPICGGVVQIG